MVELTRAANANDTNAVAARVDLPAVRSSLKVHFIEMVQEEAAKRETKTAANTAMRDALLSAIVDRMVESVITPESLTKLLRGESALPACGKAKSDESSVDVVAGYNGWHTYCITMKDKSSGQRVGEIKVTRSGFNTWRLSGLHFNPKELKPANT